MKNICKTMPMEYLQLLTTRVVSTICVLLLLEATFNAPCFADCNGPCPSTPVTITDENAEISGSRQLTSGQNTTINTSVPGKVSIDVIDSAPATIAVTSSPLAAPTISSVTPSPTGSTVYQYVVVAIDSNGNGSIPSLAKLITNGKSTLSSSDKNTIVWSSVSGAASYDVYRIVGGTTGKIANSASTTLSDESSTSGDGSSVPLVVTRTVVLDSTSSSMQVLDCSNGNIVVKLPDATTVSGKKFNFIRSDKTSNIATIVGFNGQIVSQNAAVSRMFNKANELSIQSNGSSKWACLSTGSPAIAALPKKDSRGCSDWATDNMLFQGTDGNIYGWGLSTNGNIAGGITSGVEILRPTVFDANAPPEPGAYVVDWSASSTNLFVVFSDGSVYGAGDNACGQLGFGTTNDSSYLRKITFFDSIPVSRVWTFNSGSQATTPKVGKTFFQTKSGKLYACGYNSTSAAGGALGVGNTTSTYSTPQLSVATGGGVSEIFNPVQIKSAHCATSGSFTVLCDAAGDLYVTGYNNNGQLGTGNTTNLSSFTKVSISGAAAIRKVFAYGVSAAGGYAATLDSNGVLYTAGKNTNGQLGQGNTLASQTVSGANLWYELASQGYSTGTVAVSGVTVTGTSTAWSTGTPGTASAFRIGFGSTNPGSISTWYSISSFNSATSITLGTSAGSYSAGTAYVIQAVPIVNPFVDFCYVGTGATVACLAIDNLSSLWTWGGNSTNYLFTQNTTTQSAPVSVISNIKIIAGVNTSSATAAQNSIVYDGFKLGIGGTTLNGLVGVAQPSSTGISVVSLPDSLYAGTETITDVFVNNNAASARLFILTDHGSLYATGDNASGICSGGVTGGADPVGMYRIGF